MLSDHVFRKLVLTCFGILGFLLVYEANVSDSRTAAEQTVLREATAQPSPGARLRFTATAYCKGATTASGVNPRSGVAAADPELLPVGSVIVIDSLQTRYNGIYAIMDTGPRVQGRHVDIYIWNCNEALAFGRRDIHLTVLRLGWSPAASTPSLIDTLFRRRERATEPPLLPSKPLPFDGRTPSGR